MDVGKKTFFHINIKNFKLYIDFVFQDTLHTFSLHPVQCKQ